MLRYLDCLMRAHFLTAETADALFIIVDRRISAAVIKVDGFPFHRAALDADAAFFTFFFYDIGAALEDPEDLEQVEGSFFAGFAAVDFLFSSSSDMVPSAVTISMRSSCHVPRPSVSP